ncbi:hypothetical protein RvY_06279 [Ramazzottius varieornatus]|uniref:P-type domain-containing protein n=1 Tax=Ramazzottius varieornatus TaxID=947166 RepID=A0A1D1V7P0_RAMVA|nr:hypothetical protein RvY_06279 [Ramazzottius varieornatus]
MLSWKTPITFVCLVALLSIFPIVTDGAFSVQKRAATCEVESSYKRDCGWYGINQEQCEGRGCCFRLDSHFQCYYFANTGR